jgi:hypothetical protein
VENDRPVEAHYYMNMAVSPDGNDVTVAWFNYTGTVPAASDGVGRDATTMWAATSHDGGSTFAEPIMVSSGTCVCCMESGLFMNGHPLFAFRDWHEGGDEGDLRNPAIVMSNDAGDIWDPPVTVHDDEFHYSECPHVGFGTGVDSTGQLHVSWWTGTPGEAGYYISTSADGKTFTQPMKLATQEVVPHENDVSLGVDGDDTAWVTTVDPAAGGDDAATLAKNSIITVWAIRKGAETPVLADKINGTYPGIAGTDHGAVLIWWQGAQLKSLRLES